MKNETRKISEQADEYIKASEIAERLEKKGKLGDPESAGVNMAERGVKQRLTEAQILQKQQEKKEKDKKFKEKLQKSKLKKKQKKLKNSSNETTGSLNLFVGSS